MNARSFISATVALVLSVSCSIVTGSILGWAVNPDNAAAQKSAAERVYEAGMAGSREELEAAHLQLAQEDPRFYSKEPNTFIAILKSHPFLLGGFGFLWLLLIRPTPRVALITFAIAATVFFALINWEAAVSTAFAPILFHVAHSQYMKLFGSDAT